MLKNFLWIVKKSIYGPEFYKAIDRKSLLRSVTYLFILILITETVLSIRGGAGFFDFFSEKTLDHMVSLYPDDLILTLKDGKVSTNAEVEPIYIGEGVGTHKHFLTIDTKSELSGDQLADYSTDILLKKDLAIIDASNGTRIFPLKNLDDTTITKVRLQEWVSKISPYLLPGAIALSILFFALILIFSFAYQLIYTLIPAVIIFATAKILKKELSFKASYKMAIYASTLPLMAMFVTYFIGGPAFYLSFTILTLLVALLNTLPDKEAPTEELATN